jgi:2-oxoacid:acceptor oxidoreductase gamma subunit (pyruvate/2-ketoisovalerate family)
LQEIRWHGRGGQGGFTAARLLGMAASLYKDYYVQAFPSFGPERRGAPVLGFTRIDDRPIHDHSKVYNCDYVVVLDESLLEVVDVFEGLRPDGIVLINSAQDAACFQAAPGQKVYTIDATSLAQKVLKQPVTNTVMFGALVAACELVSLEAALRAVEKTLPQELWKKNQQVVEEAYNQLRGKMAHG